MVLSGAGDALGYRNQLWEYNESGPAIHQVRKLNPVSSGADLKAEKLHDVCPLLAPVGAAGARRFEEHQGGAS